MPRLLIINNDAAFTRILDRAMSTRDYIVHVCGSLDDVAETVVDFNPDFILLDLYMNGDSVMPLIPQLKATHENCVIIVLTSYGTIRSAVWAVRNGASDYVTKPVDADELDHLMKRCVNIKTPLPQILPSPEEIKEAHIVEFFEKNDRRVATTARMLGLHRRTLQRILARLSLDGNGAEFARRATPVGRAKRVMRLWSRLLTRRKAPAKLGTRPGLRQPWTTTEVSNPVQPNQQ